ncbi:MAG: hypothetical protein ACP5OZ_05125 [Candidatus Woesearchaeota archaeon]
MKRKNNKIVFKKSFLRRKSRTINKKFIYFVLAGVLLAVIFLGMLYYSDLKKTKRITERSCGTIQGYVLQSIADEAQCKQFCTVRCESEQLRYKKSIFEQGALGECNTCTCICH